MVPPAGPLAVQVEFSGGMELLFDNQRRYDVQLPMAYDPLDLLPDGFPSTLSPGKQATDIRFLIHWLRHCLLADQKRPDLFMQGHTVRPGILVLVNDTDWELEGGLDYLLQPRDSVLFISTLHGG